MNEQLEAEKFNAELDELLERPGSPVSGEFRPELELAQRLLAADLSGESRVRKPLERSLDERAEAASHPGLFSRVLPRPRTLALCGALASALLAPVVFHLVGEPDDRPATLQEGFNSAGEPFLASGSYDAGNGALARGGLVGQSMDVVTPLNARDPSKLIYAGDEVKGVAGGSSGGDSDLSVAAPPGSGRRPLPAENAFLSPEHQPLSTFSVEADHASFAEVRRLLRAGRLPPPETVRIEAFVNAFDYAYPGPAAGEAVSVSVELAACPWYEGRKLVRIGVRAGLPAEDVKVQVEFNPARVKGYRLIGYEAGKLRSREFKDDAAPGGALEAGQSVTALYEIIPPGMDMPGAPVDPLRYQKTARPRSDEGSRELLTVKVRAKLSGGVQSRLLVNTLLDGDRPWRRASPSFRTAAAAAGFGMLLRRSEYRGTATYRSLRDLAGPDGDLLNLLDRARRLDPAALP